MCFFKKDFNAKNIKNTTDKNHMKRVEKNKKESKKLCSITIKEAKKLIKSAAKEGLTHTRVMINGFLYKEDADKVVDYFTELGFHIQNGKYA